MPDFQDIEQFLGNLPEDPHILILTGAGISAESGLGTFRGKNGLWQTFKLEEVATPEAFRRTPEKVHDFYNLRRAQLFDPAIQPNKAHKALAKLAQETAGEVTLVTQNVDNLHERAGSPDILHMHGTLFDLICAQCGHTEPVTKKTVEIDTETLCANCEISGGLRPAVVWFGEIPRYMDEIDTALNRCDLFLSIGTSGHVYPAAGFVTAAAHSGAKTAEINLEPSQNADLFDFGLYGPATAKVPIFIDKLLESQG